MTTRYVYSGTMAIPVGQLNSYASIASAITAATTGDTLIIAAGTYNETVNLNKGLRLIGAGVNSTIINGQSGGHGLSITGAGTSADVTLSALQIVGTAGASAASETATLYITGTSRNIDVSGCKIVAAGDYGILTNSGAVATQLRIHDCTVTGKTYVGTPAVQTWTGSYFSGQFANANVPRQLITINTGTFGTGSEFSNNTVGGTDSGSGEYDASGNMRANTVMTCDAAGISIKNNTFDAACYPILSGSVALRPRGNNCVVEGNIFKNPIKNGYILYNKTLSGTNGSNTVTYKNNVIDYRTAEITSGYTITAGSYGNIATQLGGANLTTTVTGFTRKCWVLSGFTPVGLITGLAYVGLGTVIESTKTTYLVSVPISGVAESYASISAAVAAASGGDVIQLADGTFTQTESLSLSKQLVVKGAGKTSTIINLSATNEMTISKSGVEMQNLSLRNNNSNNIYICHIVRESLATDTTGVTLTNVAFQATTRGVAVNGVSNVAFVNCDFPQTQNYSLGLGSVKGLTVSGCTMPSSGYGSVGVFPSTFYIGEAAAAATTFDAASSDIDLTGCSFTGASDSGAVQIQPMSGTNAISYAIASKGGSPDVTLPNSFIYAYQQQVRNAAGSDVGDANATVTNVRFLATAGDAATPGSGAYYYNALQIAAANGNTGGRMVMFGRNIDTDEIFFEPAFDIEDKKYGGAAVSENVGPVEDTTAAATAVSNTLTALNSLLVGVTGTEKEETLVSAVDALLSNASGTPAAGETETAQEATLLELIIASTEAKNAATPDYTLPNALTATPAVAALNGTAIPESYKQRILDAVPVEKKVPGAELFRYTFAVPQGSYIKLPGDISLGEMIYFPAMQNNAIYTLLFTTESSQPGGDPESQLRSASGTLEYRASTSDSWAAVAPGSSIGITRDDVTKSYIVPVVGSGGITTTNVPCFPAGQRVLTAAGWRAVETLRTGDMLVTDTGLTVPAKIYGGKVRTTEENAPVTIPAGLFGRAGPSAPVRLSPNHAISLGKGRWEMPCRLVKKHPGVVTQDAPGAEVMYYHIALPNYLRDNVVLEGGLVAESYGAPYLIANKFAGMPVYTFSKKMNCFTRTTEASLRASAGVKKL